MSVDQGSRLAGRATRPSQDAARARYDRAIAGLDPPLALVDLGAFDRNAADMTRRAAGHPVRVATKSLRCRFLIERALARPGYRGVMCYSLPEALWLHAAGTSDDLLVAYPTVDRGALRALAADEQARRHVTIMADSEAHLDVVDHALGEGHPEIRVCLELDVSWRPLARRPAVHIGTRRSPLHTPEQAADFARAIIRRAGFRLVGVMGYEGQIAGLGDAPPGPRWGRRPAGRRWCPRRAARAPRPACSTSRPGSRGWPAPARSGSGSAGISSRPGWEASR